MVIYTCLRDPNATVSPDRRGAHDRRWSGRRGLGKQSRSSATNFFLRLVCANGQTVQTSEAHLREGMSRSGPYCSSSLLCACSCEGRKDTERDRDISRFNIASPGQQASPSTARFSRLPSGIKSTSRSEAYAAGWSQHEHVGGTLNISLKSALYLHRVPVTRWSQETSDFLVRRHTMPLALAGSYRKYPVFKVMLLLTQPLLGRAMRTSCSCLCYPPQHGS